MGVSFELRERFALSPEVLYEAWMDGTRHGQMTGGEATIDQGIGGEFSAWDNYISGKTLELVPNRRIVQSWRSVEFGPDDADSRLEIELEADGDGTVLVLRHSNIPDGQPDYQQGWIDNYFEPMHDFFKG